MDWWSVAATFFAAASLIGVVWQILRFEGTQPPLGWAFSVTNSLVVTNGKRESAASFRPMGPVVIHEVAAHAWGAAELVSSVELPRMDCDSPPVSVSASWKVDEEAMIGVAWTQLSPVRRQPVQHALRVSLPDKGLFEWKWYRIPRRKGRPQGEWRPRVEGRTRRALIEDVLSSNDAG